jgi:2,3-diketo-5-methylthiopentyl-1-phosphate enolase
MLAALRNDDAVSVPLMAHPALAGAFYGSPFHGISPSVLMGQLPRLAGADWMLFPSPYGSVALLKSDALAVKDALNQPIHGLNPCFAVPSAGITEAMIPDILSDFGSDVIVNAGTGIHDHPEGTLAGTKAFRTALNQHRPQAVASR